MFRPLKRHLEPPQGRTNSKFLREPTFSPEAAKESLRSFQLRPLRGPRRIQSAPPLRKKRLLDPPRSAPPPRRKKRRRKNNSLVELEAEASDSSEEEEEGEGYVSDLIDDTEEEEFVPFRVEVDASLAGTMPTYGDVNGRGLM